MLSESDRMQPRTFFLNETHELSSADKSGGGRIPDYVGISWAQKARRVSSSIDNVLQEVQASRDPLRERRYFVMAHPVPELKKRSKDKKKAPDGIVIAETNFGGTDGRVFDRLGLDLLQVTEDGQAVVHGERDRIEQLLQRSRSLETLGAREQSRWANIDIFDTVPPNLRVDAGWLDSLRVDQPADVVFELQPVLGRVDADTVLRALADLLTRIRGEALTGTGTDFSGRYWFRGRASRNSIRAIARDFFSVQAIHSPLYSTAAAVSGRHARDTGGTSVPPPDPRTLPCVAVVDLGIPADHKQLSAYRRGQFVPQGAASSTVHDHGVFVASRVVFGDIPSPEDLPRTVGRCSYYDAVVGDGYSNRVDDKIVMDALTGVRGAAPDVRVFNLSFGDARPLSAFEAVEQREKRLLLQDLDNFAFANDVAVVVAAGNSIPGVRPSPAYPEHVDNPDWALGPWASGFNTLVCGSFVSQPSAAGLVKSVGWPSPFTRIGPGVCDAPVPSFAAEGGNADDGYGYGPGLGVWGLSRTGLAEDRVGTSFAAPILAREVALTLNKLQEYCAPGTQPFAVTARAFLALTAVKTTTDHLVLPLVERTLGLGKASARRVAAPVSGTAVILWQGIVETSKDVVRVQLPIPQAWLADATDPVLRLVVCYDPPVNESGKALWACRKVAAVLHPGPEAPAVRGPNRPHDSYPLFAREYKLARYAPDEEKAADGDLWVVEISYDEIFDYPPGMEFDPRQRVAFAAELIDRGETMLDPQPAMQALPLAASMNRLAVQKTPIRTPVIVRTR